MRTARVVPPGPGLSGLAALRAFRRDPIRLLARAAACGDVSYLKLPRFPAYLLNHPDLVRDVLVTEGHHFMKGPTMQAAKLVLGESLLTSEGEYHKRQRLMIQPIFHHERIAGYGGPMVAHALRTTGRWRDGETLDVHREMARLTLSVVGATLFGTDVETEEARAIGNALALQLSMFDRVFSPFFQVSMRLPLPSNRRFEHANAALDAVIGRMITERRGTGASGDDLLSLLIRAQEDGAGMTDRQVRDEAMTLFGTRRRRPPSPGPGICCRNTRRPNGSCTPSCTTCWVAGRRTPGTCRGSGTRRWSSPSRCASSRRRGPSAAGRWRDTRPGDTSSRRGPW